MTGRLDQLAGWEQDIRDELATVSTDLETLISRRDHLQAKLDLVRVLQNLERGAESEDAPDKAPAHTRQTTAERICEAVATILDEGGEPMHVGNIPRRDDRARHIPPGPWDRRQHNRTSHAQPRSLRQDSKRNIRVGEVEYVGNPVTA